MSEVVKENNVPEFKTVVVYDSATIENVLGILDRNTPVTGVETMRQIVTVFDTLKNEGSVQQAAVNTSGENAGYVDPSFVEPAATPKLVGEGEEMYNAEDDEEILSKPLSYKEVPSDDSCDCDCESPCESYDECEGTLPEYDKCINE